MSHKIFALIVSASLAWSASSFHAHAQGVDQFEIGKRAYHANNFETALKILRPLAERDHAEAQLIIGDMYNIGKGVRQDNSIAIFWYRKSAEQGNIEAIQMLGQGMRLLGESSAN